MISVRMNSGPRLSAARRTLLLASLSLGVALFFTASAARPFPEFPTPDYFVVSIVAKEIEFSEIPILIGPFADNQSFRPWLRQSGSNTWAVLGKLSMKFVYFVMLLWLPSITFADELLSNTDEEIFDMILSRHPDRGCLQWKYEARIFHLLFPEGSVLPDLMRRGLIPKGHGLDGEQKEPETSVNYILTKKMFDMTLEGSAPAETEVAVYEACMQYEPIFTFSTQAGGHNPDPKLRSGAGD